MKTADGVTAFGLFIYLIASCFSLSVAVKCVCEAHAQTDSHAVLYCPLSVLTGNYSRVRALIYNEGMRLAGSAGAYSTRTRTTHTREQREN